MDSNSIVAPNPRGVSWKEEGNGLKQGQCAMATYNDDHPKSERHCIASPAAQRPQLRVDSWTVTFLEGEKEQPSSCFSCQEANLFHDSLVISGARSRSLSPWAAAGSVALLSLTVLALIVIPLFHTETLSRRERVTMLYVPPAASASNVGRRPTPSISKNTPTKMSIPIRVRTPQEILPPAAEPAAGVVGGVPGGVVGGIPGGVLSGVVRSNGSGPVLVSAPAQAPKRIRVPAPMAEANLVYDVAPKYPPEAGRQRIEGIVVLMAVIGKDGIVRDVRVESGLPLLAQAAIDAVKQWRYRPYLLNGEPVEIDSQITINFSLSRG